MDLRGSHALPRVTRCGEKIMVEYEDMKLLKQKETQGKDWDKYHTDRESAVLVVAPHGGTIEPHTDLIAKAIAKDDFSLFVFRGLRRNSSDRKWLHVTSGNYEEEDLTHLQKKVMVALSVHGAANKDGYKEKTTFMGGGDTLLRDLIWARLEAHGFDAFLAPAGLDGSYKGNFVNKSGPEQNIPGVQLEISRGERDALADTPARLERYASAIREVLLPINMQARDKSATKEDQKPSK